MSAPRMVKSALGRIAIPGRLQSLEGVFLPLTTPFTDPAGGSVNRSALLRNLRYYEKIPFAGYVVAGSNGEAPYLSPEERVEVVRTVREITNKPVIGGATAESTIGTCELAEKMREVGADGLLVMPPFYFKKRMTEEALSHHFSAVAEQSGLPVVIYNMPYVTGLDLGVGALASLARHPLIRGVKDSDIRKCANTVQATRGTNFDVLIGSAGYLLGALLAGCSGGIMGLAGIMGKEICAIHSLFRARKLEEASSIQNLIAKPDLLFMSELGVAGLKRGMDLVGLAGGHCRPPILPVGAAEESRIRDCLVEAGLLPLSGGQEEVLEQRQ